MVFSSPLFLFLFLPITLLCYAAASASGQMRAKNAVLLSFSMIFYACRGVGCLFLLLFSVVVNWCVGIRVDKTEDKARKCWFVSGVVFNLGVLFLFKYLNLIDDTAAGILQFVTGRPVKPLLPEIVLPIGISFFTFQILSYQIDLYRRQVPCQRKITDLALYIMLFPQLIAGPIVRYSDVRKEIVFRQTKLEDVYEGLFRFMAGFSKKILLANSMGKAADLAFVQEGGRGLLYAWVGLFCYSLQIYLDFWAYSDMAVGLGRIFGFRFPENFNHPYSSRSIREFWRRWHISLSAWFRDYLYIPLGGSRRGLKRTCVNLLIVFALTGLWHGASWTFLLWGIYFAVFLILERLGLDTILKRLPKFIQHLYTLAVVGIGWVFFRADSLSDALIYIKDLFLPSVFGTGHERELMELITGGRFLFLFLISMLACTPVFGQIQMKMEEKRLGFLVDLLVSGIFFLAICEMMASGYNPFIYFRF